jgi:hypothetical protein
MQIASSPKALLVMTAFLSEKATSGGLTLGMTNSLNQKAL